MLNYISAELYKVTHRKYPYVFLAIIFACIGLLVFGFTFDYGPESGINLMSFGEFLSILLSVLSVGLFLCMIVGDMVFSDQYKYNTLKNEVSFGISRTRIYLGKLIAQAIVAVTLCAVIIGGYLLLGKIFFPAGEDDGMVLALLGRALLVAVPLWLGGLALSNMAMFSLKSSMVAAFTYVGIIAVAANACALLMLVPNPAVQAIFKFVDAILLTTPMDMLKGSLDWTLVGRAWLTGMGWLVGSTAVGIFLFNKREIN